MSRRPDDDLDCEASVSWPRITTRWAPLTDQVRCGSAVADPTTAHPVTDVGPGPIEKEIPGGAGGGVVAGGESTAGGGSADGPGAGMVGDTSDSPPPAGPPGADVVGETVVVVAPGRGVVPLSGA